MKDYHANLANANIAENSRFTALFHVKGRGHCHAPNTFGTVNMEHTIDLSLSWSKR